MKTYCKERETQNRTARQTKRENGVQGRRHSKTDCEEGDARKLIAKIEKHVTDCKERDTFKQRKENETLKCIATNEKH